MILKHCDSCVLRVNFFQGKTPVKHLTSKPSRCPRNWDTCQASTSKTFQVSPKLGHLAIFQASVLPGVRAPDLLLNSEEIAKFTPKVGYWKPGRHGESNSSAAVPKGTRVKSPSGPKTNSRPEKRPLARETNGRTENEQPGRERTTGPRTNNWPEKRTAQIENRETNKRPEKQTAEPRTSSRPEKRTTCPRDEGQFEKRTIRP